MIARSQVASRVPKSLWPVRRSQAEFVVNCPFGHNENRVSRISAHFHNGNGERYLGGRAIALRRKFLGFPRLFREATFRFGSHCMISTCRIRCNGLRYAARVVGETKPLNVVPGGSTLYVTIDESANPIDVLPDLARSDSTRNRGCKNSSSFRAWLADAHLHELGGRPRARPARRLFRLARTLPRGCSGSS
jgi:hypothetical protein